MGDFTDEEYWKVIICYGLNQATYKIALGKSLVNLCEKQNTRVSWEMLSREFLEQYRRRLGADFQFPQQADPSKRTFMEREVMKLNAGSVDLDETISNVGKEGFKDVIHRFHNIPRFEKSKDKFYTFEYGKHIFLKDSLFNVIEKHRKDICEELDTRWSTLEGAFKIKAENYELANDILETYIIKGVKRQNLTKLIPFLKMYSGLECFYCGQVIPDDDVHVDHVIPREVLNHDQLWNLVLAHSYCNLKKSNQLVGKHFIEKLIFRNENIMGSNHPWKNKISRELGADKMSRRSNLTSHYENAKIIIGPYYWNNESSYNPATDDFYRKFITIINNGSDF